MSTQQVVRTVESIVDAWSFSGEPMATEPCRGVRLLEHLAAGLGESTGDVATPAPAASDAKAFATSLLSHGPAPAPKVHPRRGARRAAAQSSSSWSSAPSLDFRGVADISEARRFAGAITSHIS